MPNASLRSYRGVDGQRARHGLSVRSDVTERMERRGASASDREAVQDMLDLVAAAIAPEESKQ